jgi:hypothetical protein
MCNAVSIQWFSLLLNVSRSIGASQNGYKIDPAMPYLGSYASDIINLCNIRTLGDIAYAGGQEFDTDRYNINFQGTESC